VKGKDPIEIDFHGHPARRLNGRHLSLDYLTQAGPRLVGLRLAGQDENLLAELPEVGWSTPYGDYHVYGGHRLWIGPESAATTYIPDDRPVTIRESQEVLELTGGREEPTGLRKSLRIELASDRSALTLTHRIVNEGQQTLDLAPWAITQLPLGGTVFLPQSGPALPEEQVDSEYRPKDHLVLWSYSRWDDPRLELQERVVMVHGRSRLPPCKIGTFDSAGWAAYLWQGTLFCKRFFPAPALPHIDRFCNLEVYCNDVVLELETLGPRVRLEPGGLVDHLERWELHSGLAADVSFERVARLVKEAGPG
jgi:hypothetical protein